MFLPELKEGPGSFQLDTLLAEIVKLDRVKAIGLSAALFEGFSETSDETGLRARSGLILYQGGETVEMACEAVLEQSVHVRHLFPGDRGQQRKSSGVEKLVGPLALGQPPPVERHTGLLLGFDLVRHGQRNGEDQ